MATKKEKIMVTTIKNISLCLLLLCCGVACEEEFLPEISTDPTDIVVEGYIEAGDQALPPYVILTRSIPFSTEISLETFNNLFVRDAQVTVSNGSTSVNLVELCLSELDPAQQILVAQAFGVDLEDLALNVCLYLDPSFSLVGEVGKTYTLEIRVEDKLLTARTTIPPLVPLDSIQFVDPPGNPPANLLEMRCFVTDPDSLVSFYRYFTSINGEAFIPGFNSVTDDVFFDGKRFEFPLAKGEPRNEPIEQETFGLLTVGDTLTMKWCTIDQAHYNFWNSLEFNAINQGPFSSYTRVENNINGGLGIWGGLSVSYITKAVQ